MHDSNDSNEYDSRKLYLMEMLTQTLGINTMLYIPHIAVAWGAAGNAISLVLIYISIGIPLLYMENVVGQFTGRDCLEVWYARSCLSHFGYFHICWQALYLIYLHTLNSLLLHYLIISFENPIPYYACGRWSKSNCGILSHNYSVNQECLKIKPPLPYCTKLYETFPEYQYYRFFILGHDKTSYFLAWRVSVASAVLSVFLFLCCIKRRYCLKWLLLFFSLFPVVARVIFMIGSMLQKGLVVKYEEAVDADFTVFSQRFSLSNAISEVLYSLKVGTGLSFGTASRTSFRAPCYSNSVIVVIITAAVIVLGIFSNVMMVCPYAFQYSVTPAVFMGYPLANIFEKMPRLIHMYEFSSLWLVLAYSFIAISSIGLSICILSSFIKLFGKRFLTIAQYSGLFSFVIAFSLYIVTTPLLGTMSRFVLVDIRRATNVLMLFMVMMENFVFVHWYGLGKFSEDIHFMQGVPPKATIKICWLLLAVVLAYVFISQFIELFSERNETLGSTVGFCILVMNIAGALTISTVKLLIGVYKKTFRELLRLDPTWGPKTVILQRSRAMFTAQAMTKEYIYRQYHLQAGILMRQKRSNVRNDKSGWPAVAQA
ncbi:sodium- and chloride-dependent glycine transporter 1-like [Trichoplusia ni]|uniref:Sodium- and chloride-dependent glycine transporter 1-like n=1 Tax=Trichoplusia ni TaxID=7111 RepID=A0A7E5VBL2_TRINI|nr:sodium- and chloride-dependent glycine transporter 1-like [Trichoplusia ni]